MVTKKRPYRYFLMRKNSVVTLYRSVEKPRLVQCILRVSRSPQSPRYNDNGGVNTGAELRQHYLKGATLLAASSYKDFTKMTTHRLSPYHDFEEITRQLGIVLKKKMIPVDEVN
jgi:hypothetical protein